MSSNEIKSVIDFKRVFVIDWSNISSNCYLFCRESKLTCFVLECQTTSLTSELPDFSYKMGAFPTAINKRQRKELPDFSYTISFFLLQSINVRAKRWNNQELTIQRQSRIDNPETIKNWQSRDNQELTIQRQTQKQKTIYKFWWTFWRSMA